ncbi:MAG: Ig-like domain-containing protein [Marinifilaceae bacterium]|jgi:uncharacterized protein YjdB|nr:Ig-like domain-containing protein [Marinifilaceae bacterium]
MNKKLIIYLCAILVLCSCSKKDDDLKSDNKPKEPIIIEAKSIKFSKDVLELKIGESETLRAIVTPRYATNKKVIWKSSNTKVAKVDQDGKVVALAKGKADIIITSEDDKDKTYTCELTVVD